MRPHRNFRAVSLLVTLAVLLGLIVPVAMADNLKADGDTVANGPNLTIKNCSNLPRTLFGQAVIRYQGSDHFAAGTTASLTGSAPAGITMAGATVDIPSPWNGTAGATTVSQAIQVTIPNGIANASNYTLAVNASGAKAGGGTTTASGAYKVKVACAPGADSVPPVVTVPANITVDATSQYGATVTFTASATDNVTNPIAANCVPASGSLFPVGTTSVLCYATDDAGNQGSASFTVTVRDVTAPVVTPPADVVAEATSAAGAAVTYGTASAVDTVDGPLSASCSPASGGIFALGVTTVSCSATDSHGNTGSASFHVTVRDTTPPVLTGPGPITQEATGAAGAAVTYSATASDLVDGPVTPVCSPVSGSTFGIGTTPVSCSMADSHANTSTGSFNVIVQDTSRPILALPTDITVEATGASGAAVAYTASASDSVDGPITPVCSRASGAVFALGTSTVSCSATDSHGNAATGSFKVIVVDTTAPALSLPAGATVEATGAAGAPFTFAATANDTVDGAVTVSCSPASGSTFAIGATTVTCSATDAHGNTASGGFVVSVVDTTAPAVTVPADITVEATGHAGASVTFSASASDLVDGAGLPVSCTPASGSTFALGMTDAACSATDAHGNTGSGVFHVIVVDTKAPALSLPAGITTEATGPDGATVSYSATAADVVDGSVTPSCSPTSPSLFALGTATVNCSATDAHGNTATGSFTVTVRDTTAPVVIVPANITAEATAPGGAHVDFDTAATDVVSGSITPTCSAASGALFPLADTTVTCSATDDAGNTGSKSFHVIVRDTTAPDLHLPANIVKEATGPTGAAVSWTATADDIVDGPLSVTCAPLSGVTFAIGAATVDCSATDAHHNKAEGSFTVTVRDTTAPAVSVPANITAEATGPAGAAVSFVVTANDAVDGAVTPTCAPPSGSTFAIDATPVNCSATDAHDNTGHGAFVVTVEDTTAPALSLPGTITVEATGPLGANVTYAAGATDIVDGPVAAVCSNVSGSKFALGDTTVSCTATDLHHNQASGSFHVVVRDTTIPSLTLPGNLTREATGSGGASVAYGASAADIVDGAVSVSCAPASGSTFVLGSTTVNCSATDQAGNTAHGQFTVTVVDTTNPVVTVSPGNQTMQATGPAGAAASWSASATDVVDGSVTPTCSSASGSTFPIGSTTVTCSATDAHNNTGTTSFTVIVQDTTAPIVTGPGNLTVQATSSAGATVTFTASASDLVDGTIVPVCTPPSGSVFPLGTSTVVCSGTDAHGNTGSASFTVTVRFGRDGSGIRQPINPDNTSIFKRGQSVPVKFGLLGDEPAGFNTSAWTIQRMQLSCTTLSPSTTAEDVPANNPSTTFRYDASADQYIYNADFSGVAANSCWRISVDLKDGGPVLASAIFKVSK